MFSLSETILLNAVRGGGLLSIVNSTLSPGYGIYYASGDKKNQKPFNPKSFVVTEYSGEATIGSAPKEKGAYSSFNKVQRPPELHVTFTVEGWTGYSGSVSNLTDFTLTSRSDVLAVLETMRTSAETYDIETPDTAYTSYDLTKYDYRIRSDSGVTLLMVTAVFQSVMDVGEVTIAVDTGTCPNPDAKASQGSSLVTQNVPGSVKPPAAADLSSALSGLKRSVTDATAQVADNAITTLQKATDTVTQAFSEGLSGATNQLSQSIKNLAENLT